MKVAGDTDPVSAFRLHAQKQAGFCKALGSPFTALLCRLLGARIEPASALGRRLNSWPGDPSTDALVLRITGGLHAAVLAGTAPELASLYPPAPMPEADTLWAALQPVLHAPEFAAWLDSAPQTNEVGRTGALAPGMLVVAAETGLPLVLFELGASAGLNLLPELYALHLGGVHTGDPNAALTIAPLWEGADPPAIPLNIVSRAGVDLNPLTDMDATRMLAYVWPDQPKRLQAMRAAIAIAAADPPPLHKGDAADFVEQRVWPKPGVATLLFHSIAFQYFPQATQSRIHAYMERAGKAATREAPLAWLRYEMSDPSAPAAPELRLQMWPGGTDRLLAVGHPHGASLRWLVS